jgi:selenide, water dikinase
LPRETDPALLVGLETSDDAGVYLLTEDCALVETVDIITPLVDDPFVFGQIAAANSLSDVFAMGGRPRTAMNLVFFPECRLSGEVLAAILAGGLSKIREAGACLVGGHTVEDDELKYGLSVTGTIDPAKIVRNCTARPGDVLLLTKPLGFGIISTGIKAEMVAETVIKEAYGWMTRLNNTAAALMLDCNASACTDVTGFGLIGHSVEMARGAGVTIRLQRAAIPVISGVEELIRDGLVPAGCYRNRDHYLRSLESSTITADELLPLFDPQTSGGLLISLAPDSAAAFLQRAAEAGCFARQIGEVLTERKLPVEIV